MTNTMHLIASMYNPQANGLIEMINQTMQVIIAKCIDDQQGWNKCFGSILVRSAVTALIRITLVYVCLSVLESVICETVVTHASLSNCYSCKVTEWLLY